MLRGATPVVVFLVALGVSSCASLSTGDAPAVQAGSSGSELMRLRTRHGDVAVLAGSAGRRVVVYDASGVALRSGAIESLRGSDPELFEILTTATASRATYLDATLYGSDHGSSHPGGSAPADDRLGGGELSPTAP